MSKVIRISDASSLAFHAMILLARHPGLRASTTEMAELFHASEHTLAQSMTCLVKGGFVDSVRGSCGGFSLIKSPDEITMLHIYEAVDGTLEEQHCLLGEPACNGKHCVMQGLMGRLHKELHDYLSQTRLSTLVKATEIGCDGWKGSVKNSMKNDENGMTDK
jgi:Rrf2 family protein